MMAFIVALACAWCVVVTFTLGVCWVASRADRAIDRQGV
jgi:hypothetical protein